MIYIFNIISYDIILLEQCEFLMGQVISELTELSQMPHLELVRHEAFQGRWQFGEDQLPLKWYTYRI